LFGRRAAKRRGGKIDKSRMAGYIEESSNLFWAKLLTQFRLPACGGQAEISKNFRRRKIGVLMYGYW